MKFMNQMFRKMKSAMKDESAQGATEYVLLLVVVVALVIMFKKPIMDAVKGRLDAVTSGMNSLTTN